MQLGEMVAVLVSFCFFFFLAEEKVQDAESAQVGHFDGLLDRTYADINGLDGYIAAQDLALLLNTNSSSKKARTQRPESASQRRQICQMK